jgi:hypothetical protein
VSLQPDPQERSEDGALIGKAAFFGGFCFRFVAFGPFVCSRIRILCPVHVSAVEQDLSLDNLCGCDKSRL